MASPVRWPREGNAVEDVLSGAIPPATDRQFEIAEIARELRRRATEPVPPARNLIQARARMLAAVAAQAADQRASAKGLTRGTTLAAAAIAGVGMLVASAAGNGSAVGVIRDSVTDIPAAIVGRIDASTAPADAGNQAEANTDPAVPDRDDTSPGDGANDRPSVAPTEAPGTASTPTDTARATTTPAATETPRPTVTRPTPPADPAAALAPSSATKTTTDQPSTTGPVPTATPRPAVTVRPQPNTSADKPSIVAPPLDTTGADGNATVIPTSTPTATPTPTKTPVKLTPTPVPAIGAANDDGTNISGDGHADAAHASPDGTPGPDDSGAH